jgi:hypothetical protein
MTALKHERPRWEVALFPTDDGPRYGSAWGRWGVRHGRGRRYRVYLIGSGALTEFGLLQHARRFCEAIDELTDWSRPLAELQQDRDLGLQMHRLALDITGGGLISGSRSDPFSRAQKREVGAQPENGLRRFGPGVVHANPLKVNEDRGPGIGSNLLQEKQNTHCLCE